jgi:tetratricopeptide (TPR) repeat protein
MSARSFLQSWLWCVAFACAAQQQSAYLDRLLNEGAALNQQADYARSVPLLREATTLAPQNATANYLLGVALLQCGHPAEAVVPLRVAARVNPVNEAAEGYLGDAEMELKEFPLAAEAFLTAVSRAPDSEQTLVWWTDFSLERFRKLEFSLRATIRGRAAMLVVAADADQLDWKKKEELLQQAAVLDPSFNEIRGKLGIAQALLAEEADAEASLKSAQQTASDAISTLELGALVDTAQGRWSEANQKLLELDRRSQNEFNRMVAAWPQKLIPGPERKDPVWQCLRESRAKCPLIQVEPVGQETASAERVFAEGRWEQLIAEPAPPVNDAARWFWRGVAFARLGDCIHAIPALEHGLKPGGEPGAAELANCYEHEAVRNADHLQALGKEASVHLIRGDILLSIRLDPSKAADEYGQALRLKPNDPQLLEKLAEAYFSQAEIEKARQTAQQALALNPNRKQLLRLLIQVALSERDYPTAHSLLGRLAAIEPDDAWIGVQQATAYAQTGHPEEAVQTLQPALDAGYPDEKGSLHALLAAQFRKLGRIDDARRTTAEAIRLADAFARQNENPAANDPNTETQPH